jgi:hypothetical protein
MEPKCPKSSNSTFFTSTYRMPLTIFGVSTILEITMAIMGKAVEGSDASYRACLFDGSQLQSD